MLKFYLQTLPESREYLDNIKLVDDGIERMEEVVEEFFDYDGKTVYVFTSDHGMTDWGSKNSSSLRQNFNFLNAKVLMERVYLTKPRLRLLCGVQESKARSE